MNDDRLGLKVAIADINQQALTVLAEELGAAHGEANVLAVWTDVSKLEEVVRLRERVSEAWGEVSVVRRGFVGSPLLWGALLLPPPAVALCPCPHPLILFLGCHTTQ
jgi:hypothetical protein